MGCRPPPGHELRLKVERLWEVYPCNCEGRPGSMGADHPLPPRPRMGGREDAGGVMIPPGSFLPLFLLISGSSNSAGTHLRGCAGLWSISRGYGREHETYVMVSPALTVTVGSLAIVHFPTKPCTALIASETL